MSLNRKGGLARPERFELPTFWFVARHSIQLSYGRAESKTFQTAGAGVMPPPNCLIFNDNPRR